MPVIDLSGIERARGQYVDMILRVEFVRADELLRRQRESLIDVDCDAEVWEG
ncbi:TPA_asm: hypothetical protein GahPV1_gp11 [Geoglobus ahangari pleomorphic virus 1]|uniref:Uncharacterized protein n=2 Tax=root TaxID=1 RepID=A0A0F7II24_9EURY|nr:hypothetical protein [Geoglobus ahangari]AKG92412.1 hypothetical protein GAH_00232 [Geoglobus ahangari]